MTLSKQNKPSEGRPHLLLHHGLTWRVSPAWDVALGLTTARLEVHRNPGVGL